MERLGAHNQALYALSNVSVFSIVAWQRVLCAVASAYLVDDFLEEDCDLGHG